MRWQALKAKATSNTEAKSTQSTCLKSISAKEWVAACSSLSLSGARRRMSSMLLWVFEDNHGARRFYESLGGENTNRSAVIKIAGSDMVEIAYGWTDIAPLVR